MPKKYKSSLPKPEKQNPLVQPSLQQIMTASLNSMGPEPTMHTSRLYDEATFNRVSQQVDANMKKIEMHEEMKRQSREKRKKY